MSYKTRQCESTITVVGDAISEIESLAGEMREWADNLENGGLGHTQKYEDVTAAAESLEAVSEIEVPSIIDHMTLKYSESYNPRKGRGESRAVRLANAVTILETAREVASNWLDGLPKEDENREAVETFTDELDNAISEVEGVEFPGMFG